LNAMAAPRASRVQTGVEPLDALMGGGFTPGAVNVVYGEAATGKTTLCLTAALNHLGEHRAANVYIVDSDNKLNVGRLTQLAQPRGLGLLRRLHLHIPRSFAEQEETLENLPTLDPLDLVVLDSVTGLYRSEVSDEEQTYRANKELNRQLGYITEMARSRGATFILTGQVRSILDTQQVEPVAPRLLGYWGSLVLKLEKTPRPSVRQATIEKPREMHGTVYVALGETGVTEAAP
jgi:DNA repair protein RadB